MQLRVLGPLDVVDDAENDVTALTQPRLRALLATLAAEANRPVPAEQLVDAVWDPDGAPGDAVASLHTLISRLRSWLRRCDDDGARLGVVTTPAGYTLEADEAALDAHLFEAEVADARARAATAPSEAVDVLDRALARWRGRAFAEFAAAPAVQPVAVRLEELRAGAAADRVDLLLAVGRLDDAIGLAESLCRARPLDERPHAQAMEALARAGRPADALAVHRAYRTRIRDELGLDPSPLLQRLEQRVLLGEAPRARIDPGSVETVPDDDAATGEAPADRRPADATAADPGTAAPPVFGREDLFDDVAAALTTDRLVTLTGPGGVGKTTVAAHVATQSTDLGRPWVVDLTSVAHGAETPAAIATAVGLERPAGGSLTQRLAIHLRDPPTLLVLDNCEHLIDDVAAVVVALLERCASLRVLATSREPLQVAGERVLRVGPLTVTPPDGELTTFAATPAAALFLARARAVAPEFRLTGDNVDDVHRLLRRLDGLPLALELAASKMGAMSPADMAERLTWRFRVLRGGLRGGPDRHRTLESVVDWSYDRLTPTQRVVFDLLAVFPGDFDLTAAEEVVAAATDVDGRDVAELVASLVARSMVTRTIRDGVSRYRLLETLRAYGRERLEEGDGVGRARRAHANHYLELAEALGGRVVGSGGREAVDRLDAELHNLRAVQRWAVERDPAAVGRLFRALFAYVDSRLPAEVFDWAERTVDALPTDGGPDDADSAPVLAVAASGARFRGDLDGAADLVRRARAATDDALVHAYANYVDSEIALFTGRLRSPRIDTAVGPEQWTAWSVRLTHILALVYDGRREEAALAAAAAYEEVARSGDRYPWALAWAEYTMAESMVEERPDDARAWFDRAMAHAREGRDRFLLGVTHISAAALAARHGDATTSVSRFADALDHWRGGGQRTQQWTTLRNLVELLHRLGRLRDAAWLLGATTSRDSGGPVFGEPAHRLDEIEADLRQRLGPDATAAFDEGARLGDDEVVARADAVLRDLAAHRSR